MTESFDFEIVPSTRGGLNNNRIRRQQATTS